MTERQIVAAGKATIRLDFAYDGGGLGKEGTRTLFVNGQEATEGRLEHTVPFVFSGDEGTDGGVAEATNVTDRPQGRVQPIPRQDPPGHH